MKEKLKYDWKGDELIITQCNDMVDNPANCEKCEKRFACFTERSNKKNVHISSVETKYLEDMLKQIRRLTKENS